MAAALYAAGVAAVYGIVTQALDHETGAAASPAAKSVPADLAAVDSTDNATLLSALTVASHSSPSVVQIRAGRRRGTGFVAWVDAGRSYLLTARPVVSLMLRSGGREVKLVAGGKTRTGRVIAVDKALDLAVVRVRGKVGAPVLRRRLGRLQPGMVAVTAPPRGGRRGQAIALGSSPAGRLVARAHRSMRIGAPVFLLGGAPAGILAGGGRTARVVPLDSCSTWKRCLQREARGATGSPA